MLAGYLKHTLGQSMKGGNKYGGNMQAIILAAGAAKRLGGDTPKALVEVGGLPMITRVSRMIRDAGISDMKFVLSPETANIRDERRRVIQPEPRGTADALRCAGPLRCVGAFEEPVLMMGCFLLLGCDTLFAPAHVRAVAEYEGVDIVLSVKQGAKVHHSTITYSYGCIVEGIAEKPEFPTSLTQSLMLYRLPSEIMGYLSRVRKSRRGEYEIQDAINFMIRDGATVALVECEDYFHLTKQEDVKNYERDSIN